MNERKTATPQDKFPFTKALITNRSGRVTQVVMDLNLYRALVEAVEDAGLYEAMKQTAGEHPLSHQEALSVLNQA